MTNVTEVLADETTVDVAKHPLPIIIRQDRTGTLILSIIAEPDRHYPKFLLHRFDKGGGGVNFVDVSVTEIRAGSPGAMTVEELFTDARSRFLVDYAQLNALWNLDGDGTVFASQPDYARDALLIALGRWNERQREVAP